jgi:15-cis-phytoene synthase
LLGADEPEAFRRFGAAYAVAGQVRTMRPAASRGQCLIPVDLLARHGLTVHDAIAAPDDRAVRDSLTALVREGQAMLGGHGRVPRPVIAAALPASLARRDFARWLRRPGSVVLQRGIGDKLWVIAAALTRRC